MENISKIIGKTFCLILLLFKINVAISQQNYIVYEIKGEPFIKLNDSVKSIYKGSILTDKTVVITNTNDVVHFIDDKGNIFNLKNKGEYTFSDLQKIPAIKDNSSFTKKYFSYMWKELTNQINPTISKSGVVYRGDGIVLMRYPADSIKIYSPEIKFEWNQIKGKTKEYYFILKDLDTNKITKIGTHSNSITLFVDSLFLKEGGNYKWAVTETKYPNFKKTVFYNFKLLNQSEFTSLEKEIKDISTFLKGLGLNKNQIKKNICTDFKICY